MVPSKISARPRISVTLALALALALAVTLAAAPASRASVSAGDLIENGMPPGFAEYAANVTASEGNWRSQNQYGCLGAFQLCPGTFERYYSGSPESFLRSERDQVRAWMAYQRDEWDSAKRLGLDSLVGENICHQGKCATVTQSSILKACQFGCQSVNGKLGSYLQTGSCDARGSKDGNGVSVCRYLISGAGYDVAAVTGMSDADRAKLSEEGGGGEGRPGEPSPAMPLMRWTRG